MSGQVTSHWDRASPLPSSHKAFRKLSSWMSRRSSTRRRCFENPSCDWRHTRREPNSEKGWPWILERPVQLTCRGRKTHFYHSIISCGAFQVPTQRLACSVVHLRTVIWLYNIGNIRFLDCGPFEHSLFFTKYTKTSWSAFIIYSIESFYAKNKFILKVPDFIICRTFYNQFLSYF